MGRADCHPIVEAHERLSQQSRLHVAGCEAARAALAECLDRGAGIADLGSAIALAGIVVRAYRDATLGPDAPEPPDHASAVHAAGEELQTLIATEGLSGGVRRDAYGRIARTVIGTYHTALAVAETR